MGNAGVKFRKGRRGEVYNTQQHSGGCLCAHLSPSDGVCVRLIQEVCAQIRRQWAFLRVRRFSIVS